MNTLVISGARVILIVLLSVSVLLFLRDYRTLSIDTDIKSLVPQGQSSEILNDAINNIGSYLQERLVFLIDAPTDQAAEEFTQYLLQQLETFPEINAINEDETLAYLQAFVEGYRFTLLTPQQHEQLAQWDRQQIVSQAIREKFGFNQTPQILPADKDPLAWSSDVLLQMLASIDGGAPELADNVSVVTAQLAGPVMSANGASMVAHQVQSIASEIQSGQWPGVKFYYSGVLFYADAAASGAKRDASLISGISLLGIVVLFLLVFRSLVVLMFPMVSIAFAVAVAFVVCHAFFGEVHVLTIVFGASLIGVVVDYSVHYFYHGKLAHKERGQLHKALLLSMVSSILGYCALAFSHLAVLSQVAVFSGVGLFTAMAVVLALCPLFADKVITHDSFLQAGLQALQLRLGKVPLFGVVTGIVALFLAGLVSLGYLKPNDNPSLFFTPNPNLLAMDAVIASKLNQYEPGAFVVVQGESAEDIYQQSNRFFDAVAGSQVLKWSNFVSVTDLLPSRAEQENNYALQERLYDMDGVIDGVLESLGSTLDTTQLRQQFHRANGQYASPDMVNKALNNVLPPLWLEGEQGVLSLMLVRKGTDIAALNDVLAGFTQVEFYRTVTETSKALAQQKQSALRLLVVAYAGIALFLLLFYRKLSALTVLILPLAATASVIVGFTVLGIGLSLFHVMAFFLVLGLGLDYGIFVYTMDPDDSLSIRAIFISAITSLLSFGLLALSSTPVVQGFGLTLLIANSVNLMGALLLKETLFREKVTS